MHTFVLWIYDFYDLIWKCYFWAKKIDILTSKARTLTLIFSDKMNEHLSVPVDEFVSKKITNKLTQQTQVSIVVPRSNDRGIFCPGCLLLCLWQKTLAITFEPEDIETYLVYIFN